MDLNQVTVPSADVSKSILFYETLGLKLIVHTHEAYARFECPNGSSTFSVHSVENLPSGPGVIIYFECEDLDDRVEKLVRKGIRFSELPSDKSWLWREARLKDPDGNQLILFKAEENRKYPPWRKN